MFLQNNQTPLHIASWNGHADAVDIFFKYQAAANHYNNVSWYTNLANAVHLPNIDDVFKTSLNLYMVCLLHVEKCCMYTHSYSVSIILLVV